MKIYLGADHAGYQLKEKIKNYLTQAKIEFEDKRTFNKEPVDYPDIAKIVGERVVDDQGEGILVCGAANGMVIAANKIKGIRAVVGYSQEAARFAREDNDANILCFGGRLQSFDEVEKILDAWFGSEFSGEDRHKTRIKKIAELENG